MLTRIITGAVLVIVLLPALIYYDTFATPALWAVISAVSIFEVARCVGLAGSTASVKTAEDAAPSGSNASGKLSGGRVGLALTAAAIIITIICPAAQFVVGGGSENAESLSRMVPIILAIAFAAVFALYACGVFGFIKSKRAPTAELLMMLIYVSASSVSAVAISQLPHGGFILPMIFLGSWITDSFAYFCGSFFGKHKLIPSVSPKKTVEGSVGGTVLSVAFFAVYGVVVGAFTELTVDYAALLCTGLVLSILSQIGDLNASYIKRTHGIKDFGNLFPGHGGMLDRFDSVIAVTPFLYALSLIFTYFA